MSDKKESFQYDHQKIFAGDTPEKKELALFQWLSNLEKDISMSTKEELKQVQGDIEKRLLEYLKSETPPRISKPLRHLVSRCFNLLYTIGDQRNVFDTIAAIQKILSSKLLGNLDVRLYIMIT